MTVPFRRSRWLWIAYLAMVHLALAVALVRPDWVEQFHRRAVSADSEADRFYLTLRAHHRRLDRGVAPGAVPFIGSSSVQGLDVAGVTPRGVNFGLGGDTTAGALDRIRELRSVRQARAVVLAVGWNDVGRRPVDAVLADYRRILDAVPAEVPTVVNAIQPPPAADRYPRLAARAAPTRALNAGLRRLCAARSGCRFLDLAALVGDGAGRLAAGLHEADGIHLNAAGYRRWAAALRGILAAIDEDPPVSTQPAPVYYHDLDAARALLMILGVFLHAANVYAAGTPWLVSDRFSDPAFNYISASIHLFRMPAFFIISGFFCAWSLGREAPGPLLAKRARRLGIPLLATLATLNVVQALAVYLHRHPGVALAEVLGPPHWSRLLATTDWLTHLWFLVVLIAYFAAVCGALALFPGAGSRVAGIARRAARLPAWPVRSGLVVLALPLASLAMLAAPAALPILWSGHGALTGYTFFQYLPFFGVGMWVGFYPQLLDGVLRARWWHLPLAAGTLWGVYRLPAQTPDSALGLAADYNHALASWVLAVLAIGLCRRLLRRPSWAVARLAASAYTIYLVHHLLVIGLGILLAPAVVSPWLKYALVVAATLAASGAAHWTLVERRPALRRLYNGR